MSAIKFSKQYIKPNPLEVDYWIDLTSNPYGNRIKYFDGIDWVDLINSEGSVVNLSSYYDKLLINAMLSSKASVESVNSKVDDTEISEVIKNIEIKDRGNSGVELVILRYDNTTVGVTMPIASSTTSGIVTTEAFKDFVKLYLLLELYTEMYNKLSEIRSKYQKKLKAGKNIIIDETTNTISASGKISIDWNDIQDKPDFKSVATSGDYNDLINKLKPGTSIDISNNTISVDFDINNYITDELLSNKITDLVDVYTGSTYITVNGDNSIEVKFADLATALSAEGNAVGNAIKANSDAVAAEQLRAEGAEGVLRADLGNNTDSAASEGSAFARIAQLKLDIASLTGGAGSISSQIESAINTLKGDMTSSSIGVLEDKVEANETAINTINEAIEGLDVEESTGDYVKTISQANGRISVTTGTFNFDEAGAAAKALVDANAYTDEALTWHEA